MDRIEFSIVTKRIEWLKASGTDNAKRVLLKYLADGKVPARIPRSRCRVCRTALTWGSGTYNFDHKDNNSANTSQRNCFLVCRNCHGRATKTRVVREYDPWFGSTIGYRTQKLRVGYKKTSKKASKENCQEASKEANEEDCQETSKEDCSETTLVQQADFERRGKRFGSKTHLLCLRLGLVI